MDETKIETMIEADIQGDLYHPLRRGENLLKSNKIGAVDFEYGRTWIDSRTLLLDLWKFVKKCDPDARFFKLHPDGPHPICEYRQNIENFQLSNWLILSGR